MWWDSTPQAMRAPSAGLSRAATRTRRPARSWSRQQSPKSRTTSRAEQAPTGDRPIACRGDERSVRRRGQDSAGYGRLARDRADDRARPRGGRRARDRLLAQGGRAGGGRGGARRARRLRGDHGRRLHTAGCPGACARHEERFAQLDILVNNAGAGWGAPLEEFPASGWDKVSHTNVEGVFHLTVALLRSAARRGWRRATRRA